MLFNYVEQTFSGLLWKTGKLWDYNFDIRPMLLAVLFHNIGFVRQGGAVKAMDIKKQRRSHSSP
jgi:hypothetical protein